MTTSIQYFHVADLTDPKAHFASRSQSTKPCLLQSHGWVDGVLQSGTIEEAAQRYKADDANSWPVVVPSGDQIIVDRYNKRVTPQPIRVPMHRIRHSSSQPPLLSLVFVRWGGKHRIGEDTSDEALATDGGWGSYGCPPCDWYMDALVNEAVMRYPGLGMSQEGKDACPDCEILSIFLGSSADMRSLAATAPSFSEQLRGAKKATLWMLWPADWEADWNGTGFEAYVERKALFTAMRSCEAAGTVSSFPHPAVLWEYITSKAWMATLCEEPRVRLPAATLAARSDIMRDPAQAAAKAWSELEARRQVTVFAATGGPAKINAEGLKKGVVKLGWSWEAKFVWFWKGQKELANCLYGILRTPGCLADTCIVQEWVDFDFELRLFFFPPRDWTPGAVLKPKHYEYTTWETRESSREPGSFSKPSRAKCLQLWENDEAALDMAHAQAEEAGQCLIQQLHAVHSKPVPMIRLDFMLKRRGPGEVQVAFGEYCETGCCCLQWPKGPPTVWQACLDYALN